MSARRILWTTLISRLRGGELRRDTSGAAAILFAIVFFAVAAAALLQIDMARAISARQTVQDALDAATLAAARSKLTDQAKLQKLGEDFFAAQLKTTGLTGLSATFASTETSVVASAQGDVQPYFAGMVMGKKTMAIKAETEVKREFNTPTEIALVLDTTFSMTPNGKLDTLKAAAKDLVQKVTTGGADNVKVAVIPFGQYVNVGLSRRKEPWLDVAADSSVTETVDVVTKGKCTTVSTKTTCTKPAQNYSCTKTKVVDGVTVSYQGTCTIAASGCTTVNITPVTTCTQDKTTKKTTTTVNKWNGCVGSPRPYPKNVLDSDPSRKYPGLMNEVCGSEILTLTDKTGPLVSTIQTLSAVGETYIPAGLSWGWNALSPPQPLMEAAAYDATGKNKKPRKALVLMTDGENTLKMIASDGAHKGPVDATANKYTAELCANIKAAKIEVFTVAFAVTNAATKSMLSACASDSAHYFDASDNAALTAAFQSIADSLQTLHISR